MWRLRKCTFLNLFMTDLPKLICMDFGKSEFLKTHISNWYKALYLACSSIFWYLDFFQSNSNDFMQLPTWHICKSRQPCLQKILEILSSIPHYRLDKTNQKLNKIKDMTFTRIRLLLGIQ